MNRHIYKIIILILSLSIILSVLSLVIAANTKEPITEQAAKEILFKSIDFAHRVYIPMDGLQYDASESIYIHPYYYSPVIEENLPGGSYEAMKEYATTIYTNDIAANMYSHCRGYYNSPIFITDDTGKLRMTSNESSFYMTWWYNVLDWTNFTISDMTIKLVKSNEEEATVWFKYTTESSGDFWTECYMINTDNGWRITESPFTRMLESNPEDMWYLDSIPYEASPSTGDPAVGSFVILPVISLACLVPAVCLLRRRRRTVA